MASTAPALAAARMLSQPHAPWSVLTANSPGAYYDQWALRGGTSCVTWEAQPASGGRHSSGRPRD